MLEDIEELEERINSINSPLNTDKPNGKGKTNKKPDKQIAALVDMKNKLNNRIVEAEEIKADITDTITKADKPVLVRLLHDKYIKGFSWYQIARDIGYTQAHTKGYLHNEALRAVEVIIKQKN